MPATLQHDSDNLYLARISGVLTKAELERLQAGLVREFERHPKVRVLFQLEQFEGWQPGANWNDVSFYVEHGAALEKIAIVGDEEWREEALTFAGAGVRKAPVAFFAPELAGAARDWLAAS